MSPIQYQPITNQLIVYESLRIEIAFTGAPIVSRQVLPEESEAIENLLQDNLINYETATQWRYPDITSSDQLEGQRETRALPWTPPTPGWRVKVRADGMYKLSFAQLQAAGLPVTSLDPHTFRMFTGGEEMAIKVVGEGDGVFSEGDYILFYGKGIDSKYTLDNVYWLTYGQGNGLRMGSQNGAPGTATIPAFRTTKSHWESNVYYINFFPGANDIDHFLWSYHLATATASSNWTYNFNLLSTFPGNATLKMSLLGFTPNLDHHVKVFINAIEVGDVSWDGKAWRLLEVSVPQNVLQTGTNAIRITNLLDPNTPSDLVYLDWFDLEYPNTFAAENNAIAFTYKQAGTWKYQVSGFTTNQVEVYDVSNPISVVEITGGSIFPSGSVYSLQFQDTITEAEDYFALTNSAFKTVQAIEADTSSNLQSTMNGADHITITHQVFSTAATTLKNHRISQGLEAVVVDVQDIYDEFNFGIVNPTAIQDFLMYAYNNWQSPAPAYVVLLGDGHYDPKNYLSYGRVSYIPPYLANVDPWIGETAADNRYVTLVGTDIIPDMMLGRISVNSLAEANAFINKIIAYETAPAAGDWVKQVLAVTDNADLGGNFPLISNNLLTCCIPSSYPAQKIYYGTTPYTDATTTKNAIVSAFNAGKLLVNYIGHGYTNGWASESLFYSNLVASLTNGGKQPVVLAMTCSEGYYIKPNTYVTGNNTTEALGEVVTRADGKGAIASWSPTGQGVASGHDLLNRGFLNAYFLAGVSTIGEATMAGKLNLGGAAPDLLDTYLLFGDPATIMARPVKAVNVAYEVDMNSVLTVPAPGVLGNAYDSDGDPLTATLVSSVQHGSLLLNANGSFNYTPNTTFVGTDSFRYKASDGTYTSNIATVTITVNDSNVHTHTITLEQGWNLVSFNLQPTSTTIADVLASIAGNYSWVYAWNAIAQDWQSYDASAPPYANSLTSLDPTMGFWIKATTSDILTVEGTAPTNTNISLKTGWNLVGYPSMVAQGLPGVLTNNGVSSYLMVIAYEAADSDPWKINDPFGPPYINDLLQMTPGRGYWIDVTQDSTWNVMYEP